MKARTWFRVHSFTGVITGLLLFVVCWSGTFAVVSNEIDWLFTPERRVQPQAERATWQQIYAAAQAARPSGRVTSISAPLYRNFASKVRVTLPNGDNTRLFIAPYTAAVAGNSSGFTVQRFFRDLHRHLFFPLTWGIYVVSLFP